MRLSYKRNNLMCFQVDSIDILQRYFHFSRSFKLIESDLDIINEVEDLNNRKLIDAQVLSLIAANARPGKMLDIGTYHGRSATRMAINSPRSTIYTVNIHPNEINKGGKLVTGAPSLEEIGSFFRERGIKNIKQIYANTKNWQVPNSINNLSLVYIDGCHDKEFVYNDTKLIIERVRKDGFILWHDFSPLYRDNFPWIDEAMLGVEKLIRDKVIKGYILNVKNSWIGIWQKKY